jgi:hypothetical protein
MSQAMTAPMGPVAPANVLGSEKIPAPTIPPTTIAVSAVRDIFCSAIFFHPAAFVLFVENRAGRELSSRHATQLLYGLQ